LHCDCCAAGTGPTCGRAACGRDELARLEAAVAEATSQACAAYQDNARLVRVLSIIAQPSAPEALSDEVLRALSQTYDADLVCITRLIGDRLIVVGACGLPEGDPAFTDGWHAGRTATDALRRGEAVGKGHAELDGDADVPALLTPLRIRSAAWVPVRSEGTGKGTLLMLFRRSNDAFDPIELRGLESVTTRLAVAVEARERGVLAERLARSGHRLARHLSFSSLYRDASLLLQELLGTGTAWVITIDGGSACRPWPAPDNDPRPAAWPRPADALPGWNLLVTGVPVRTTLRETPAPDEGEPRETALLCVPVMSGNHPAAVLHATRDAARPFLPDEVEAGITFANYLGSAMINTELYQALKNSEATLRHRATHDVLTGLANRDLANEYLNGAVTRDAPTGVGLLFCDLDKFKAVNDRLGHDVGDTLLRLVAERLRQCLREEDLLARLGGDEFIFILDGIDSMAELSGLGERVTAAMQAPFMLGGEATRVTMSVGAVWGRRGQATSLSLLRDADAAMYAAKATGGALLRVFDDDASPHALDALSLRSDLCSALDRNQLSLRYQPIFDLATGEIEAFEALPQWIHPTHGRVTADQFMPLAEESGEIIPIGTWVITEACRQLAAWQRGHPARRLSMSLNISPVHLRRPELATPLLRLIEGTGVAPADVWLELSQSHALDESAALTFITQLREAGVHFALNHVGVSYANLSHLRQSPVEGLKLDRSFIAGLTQEGHQQVIDRSLVQAMLTIAGSLDLTVVAEGVETPAQRTVLTGMGCRLGQGALLADPLPAVEATRLLQDERRPPTLTDQVPAPRSPHEFTSRS
jgi:diguanylate cyclase (GGDEF)-like protein